MLLVMTDFYFFVFYFFAILSQSEDLMKRFGNNSHKNDTNTENNKEEINIFVDDILMYIFREIEIRLGRGKINIFN